MEKSYFEHYDLDSVKYLLTLPNNELKDAINETKKEYNSVQYIKSLKQFLHTIVASKDGVLRTTYKPANGRTDGRRYTNGMRLQGVAENIRNFIVKDFGKDYDMGNCFPTLLLYLCKKHINNPSVYPLLTDYVHNRSSVLENNEITKTDILVNMNKDNARPKNEFLKKFVKEQSRIKDLLIPYCKDYTDFKSTNEQNPISSTICQVLCVLEDRILTKATESFRDVALIFDGFICFETVDLTKLNTITEEYGIIWKVKPFTTTIKIPEDFKYNDFRQDQLLFETKNHIIRNPLCYMRKSGNTWTFNDKTTTDQIYANMPKYTPEQIPFLKMWYSSPTRKEYETTNFIPFNKTPPTYDINEVFNTFTAFSRMNYQPTDEDLAYSNPLITQFQNLIMALCENNDEIAKYLSNYVADIIQNPERLPETVIVLQGREGAGKDTLINIIKVLLDNSDDYVVRTDKPELILGRFNSMVKDSLVVQFNEFSNKNAIEYKEPLKNLATEAVIPIEYKNIDKKLMVNNYARVFLFSNNNRPVIISESNRRFCAIRTTDKYLDDRLFFGAIKKNLKDPKMVDGLFHYLNTLPLTNFNTRVFPRGSLYSALRDESIHSIYKFLYTIDIEHINVMTGIKNNNKYIKLRDLRDMYINYGANEGINTKNIKTGQIKLELGKDGDYITFIKKNGYDYCKFNYEQLMEYLQNKYFNNDDDDDEDEFE